VLYLFARTDSAHEKGALKLKEKKIFFCHSNILHHLQQTLLWMVYKATLVLHKYFKANFNIIFIPTFGSFLHTQPKCGMHFPFLHFMPQIAPVSALTVLREKRKS
jgi:hypothetical protein